MVDIRVVLCYNINVIIIFVETVLDKGMRNKEWVHEYINKLFTIDIVKEGVTLRDDKLDYINLPLYKYCFVCEETARSESTIDYNIDNFEKDVLFFQTPSNFNDPFDCFLGFSQSQMIRDLLTQELRRKRQLTPQNRKAIALLFNNNDNDFDLETISNSEAKPIIELILSMIPDDPLKSVYNEILQTLCEHENEVIKKLVTNTMTIRDKQAFVDLMYENETFIEAIKKDCTPENWEFVLKTAPRDMKIKIENQPDSFMNNDDGGTLSLIDFFKLFAGIVNESSLPVDVIDEIKQKFNEASNEVLDKSRKIISNQLRITCLSEKMDSPLMWSHYANKHYGFCLEYDFTTTLTQRRYPDLLLAQLLLFPVYYSVERPLLSKALFSGKTSIEYIRNKKLPPNFLKNLINGLLCKSKEWAYEQEWRIFQFPSETPTMHLPKARKVFLGTNMEERAKDKVTQIAEKKNIPVYQMFLRSDKYKFDYYQVK